jgi:hypothetical protein
MHPPPPSGAPLVARWGDFRLGPVRAGALHRAEVAVENAGAVTWATAGATWILASYHWLDAYGNPIVWDGIRTPLPRPVRPGERIDLRLDVRAPLPPGRYRLAVDLLDEGRLWFAELGNAPLESAVEVLPRLERRTLAVDVRDGSEPLAAATRRALAAQEEPLAELEGAEAVAYLAAGCEPARDWSRRILDAHVEGYAAVGGSVVPPPTLLGRRRQPAALAPWTPGGGRNPGFAHPLLCASVLREITPDWAPDVEGLPALSPPGGEPWLYDGRISVIAPPRSGRRRA